MVLTMAWPIREVNGLLASLNDMPKKKRGHNWGTGIRKTNLNLFRRRSRWLICIFSLCSVAKMLIIISNAVPCSTHSAVTYAKPNIIIIINGIKLICVQMTRAATIVKETRDETLCNPFDKKHAEFPCLWQTTMITIGPSPSVTKHKI